MKRSSSKKGGPAAGSQVTQPKKKVEEIVAAGGDAPETDAPPVPQPPILQDSKGSEYEAQVKKLASFSTVQEFWQIYNHLTRPSVLPSTMDQHLFLSSVKPTWEDPANWGGGKFSIHLKKGLASRYWEDLTMALIGGQLASPTLGSLGVNGLVLSIRWNEDILSIWNDEAGRGRDGRGRERREKIADAVRSLLNLPERANIVSSL
jgi:translation initiation factor 4E